MLVAGRPRRPDASRRNARTAGRYGRSAATVMRAIGVSATGAVFISARPPRPAPAGAKAAPGLSAGLHGWHAMRHAPLPSTDRIDRPTPTAPRGAGTNQAAVCLEDGDRSHLDQVVGMGERADLDHRRGRPPLAEELVADHPEVEPPPDVRHVGGDLDHVVEGAPGALDEGFDRAEHLAGLTHEVPEVVD